MVKKIIYIGILIIIILASICVEVYALSDTNTDYAEHFDILLNATGADRLFNITPTAGKDFLYNNNIKQVEASQILSVNIFDLIESTIDTFKENIQLPLTILLSLIGVILLSSLLDALKTSFNQASYEHIFAIISVICISGIIIKPISSLILEVQLLIEEVSSFLLGFIPVYVGLLQVSGKPISATVYSTSFIGIIQIISRISATILVPLLGIYLAFCLIGATSTQINTISIAKSVKTTVITSLSFLLTLFVALLTMQGGIATASDSVTLKTAKFVAGNFLPVVGSAIGDAMTSVHGSLALIKSTIGGFAGLVLIGMFLPSVISIILMQTTLKFANAISDTLGTEKISNLLTSADLVLGLILGIVLVFAVLLIVSIGMLFSMTI